MKLIQMESVKKVGEAIILGSEKAYEKNVFTVVELSLIEMAIGKMMEEVEKYAVEIPENIQEENKS